MILAFHITLNNKEFFKLNNCFIIFQYYYLIIKILKFYENLKFLKLSENFIIQKFIEIFLNLMKYLKFYQNFELKKKKLFKIQKFFEKLEIF